MWTGWVAMVGDDDTFLAIASRTSVRSSCSEMFIDVHAIDDTNDSGVDRRAFPSKGFTSGATFENDQHLLVNAGTNAVNRQ